LLAVLAVAGLVVAGLVVVRELRGAALPTVVVLPSASADPANPAGSAGSASLGEQGAAWQAGADGRPEGPARLVTTVAVRRAVQGEAADRPDAVVRVVGMAGPGVTRNLAPPVQLPADGRAVDVLVVTQLDCRQVPAAVADDAFRLRIEGRQGSRTRSGLVSGGSSGRRWADAVQLACGSWTARRDLTVSALTARADPVQPNVEVTLTVGNTGPRDATVTADPASGEHGVELHGLPIRVPAHGSATATISVLLQRCDIVDDQGAPDHPALSSMIDLVALAGAAPTSGSEPPQPGEGSEPTGVVLADPVGRALADALGQACGGLDPLAVLVPSGGVRYDAGTRDLDVQVVIDVPPGRVRALSLTPVPVPSDDRALHRPLWTSTPELVPDSTGQVRTTLPYHSADAGPCPVIGGYLPAVVATLHVPGAAGERVLRYSLFIDITEDRKAVAQLCDPAQSGVVS
jgi:hypothetical protein